MSEFKAIAAVARKRGDWQRTLHSVAHFRRLQTLQENDPRRNCRDGAAHLGKPRLQAASEPRERRDYLAPRRNRGRRARVPLARRTRAVLRRRPRTLWIVGGAKLYETALDFCSELVISRVKMSPQGDVFFPKFDGKFKASETILSHPQFDVVRYVRRK